MTVGMPGTGIGGMFYLLSALAMPLSEAYRWLRGHASGGWRVVAAQTSLAAGILAGMWVTGWLLGLTLRAVHVVTRLAAGPHAGNALRTAALVLSFGTLAGVLCGVELLRLWIRRPARDPLALELSDARSPGAAPPTRRRAAAGGARVARLVLLVALGTAAAPQRVAAQSGGLAAVTLARADSAFAAGNGGVAARQYAAVLAADPANSHAVYRLGQLQRDNPTEAARLFQRYVALEPSDPWGYMALGDALARAGRYDAALRWYDRALHLAPGERDAVVGRARVLARARRTDAAIVAYRQWLASHPGDAEAWGELAREALRAGRPDLSAQALERVQTLAPNSVAARRLILARAAAAPALTPLVSGSHDSDGNATLRLGGSADLAARDGVRFGVAASRERIGGGAVSTGLSDFALRAAWRPRAALQLEGAAGATALDAAAGAGGAVVPTGQLRLRWRAPAGGPALDLRAQRSVLDATPLLVTNRVVRSELGSMVELPVGAAVRLRGIGRAAALSDSADLNHRVTLAGVVAVAATPGVELSGQFHQIRYDHATAAGYFAPHLAQLMEVGSYLEFETARGALFSCDLGAGVQRVALQGAAVGPWRRALSLYSLIILPVAAGRDLKLEVDAEDSPIASEAARNGGGPWRYLAASLSLRWALP
jgi:tetratricopeptide (TPR) repeat protein